MSLLRLAGFRAVRITSYWHPGLTRSRPSTRPILRNVGAAAALTASASTSPSTTPARGRRRSPPTAQAEFAQYAAALVRANPRFRDVIVGNEPNLNRFWLPQFNLRRDECLGPRLPRALARPTTRVKAVDAGRPRLGRRARPAGHRPARNGTRHDLADELHPRARRGLPGERPQPRR